MEQVLFGHGDKLLLKFELKVHQKVQRIKRRFLKFFRFQILLKLGEQMIARLLNENVVIAFERQYRIVSISQISKSARY